MLKGKTTIELTDVNTGEVKVVEDTNFMTNAFHDLCQPILRHHDTYHDMYSFYSKNIDLNEMMGGILLFDTELGDNPDNYIPPITANMTGHASELTYSGTDLSMGSFNVNLSDTVSPNTRKYVWDFNSEQANGTIGSVCLTTKWGGTIGHGSTTPCESSLSNERIFGNFLRSTVYCNYDTSRAYLTPLYLSFKDDYVLYMQANINMTSGKFVFLKVPIWSNKEDIFVKNPNVPSTSDMNRIYSIIGKNSTDIEPAITLDLTSVLGTTGYLGFAQDGKYLYIARNKSSLNSYNWAPNTKITIVKVNLEDLTFESFEVTNTTGDNLHIFDQHPVDSFFLGYNFAICNDYMFVVAKGTAYNSISAPMYAINLSDNTVVHKLATESGTDIEFTGTSDSDASNPFLMTLNNKVVVSPKGNVCSRSNNHTPVKCVSTNDFVIKTLNVPHWGMCADNTENTSYENGRVFPTDNPLYIGHLKTYYISTAYTSGTFNILFVPNVLMTINNLDTPVTKTSSQTMRITYTLTKEE